MIAFFTEINICICPRLKLQKFNMPRRANLSYAETFKA